MPDESGRAELALEAELRAEADLRQEFPGEEPPPAAEPDRGVHYQDEHGLRLTGSLTGAPDGSALVKQTLADGSPGLTHGTILSDSGVSKAALEAVETILAAELAAREAGDANAVLSKRVAVGNLAGKLKPDLSLGQVFTVTSTGVLEPEPPINPQPPTGHVLYVEVWIFGKFAIKPKGLADWIFGVEPEWKTTGSAPLNILGLASIDDGANWYGVGAEGLPASVVRVSGATAGQVPISDGAGGWGPGTPATSGLKASDVEAILAEQAVLNGGHNVTIGGTSGPNKIPFGASTTVANWTDISTVVPNRLTLATITSGGTTALEPDHYYRVTGLSSTLTLPGGVAVGEGARIIVENAALHPIKVKGRFTSGSEAVTTLEVSPGEVLTFIADANATLWRATSVYKPRSQSAGAVAGGFVAQTIDLPGANAPLVPKTIHIAKMVLPSTLNASTLFVNVITAGAGLGACYAGLYSAAGVLLGFTVDEHVAFESTGMKKMKLGTGEGVLEAGFAYAALLCASATTPPALAAAQYAGQMSALNFNLSASELRCGEAQTTEGGAAAYATLPLLIDPTKSKGKTGSGFPLFFVAAD